MSEQWRTITHFEDYLISSYGRIINNKRKSPVRQSFTKQGDMKVGLTKDGVQHTRSVRLLVAEEYVDGKTFIFDTPINLDGDPTNNRSDNIAWRPRWFAWKYKRQFKYIDDIENFSILEDNFGNKYFDVIDAATKNGLLFEHVIKSIKQGIPIFPSGHIFYK